MPIRKNSKSDKSKKNESQQREQGQGEIPPVPKSPDDRPLTLESEGACGQSSTAEDSEHLEELQCHDSEEADGGDSKQASGRKMSWREKRKFKREQKKQDKRDKDHKGRKQDKKEQKEQTTSASHSKHGDKKTSQSSQHPPSLSEAPLPPQRHHTHSESSQGSHTHANSQDATIEEGAKQASPEAQGVRRYTCMYVYIFMGDPGGH